MKTAARPPVVRWNGRAALRAVGGNPAFLDELVALYLKDAARGLARLKRLGREAKLQDIAREAHRLKGSSLTLRLEGLGEVCRGIETAAQKGNAAGVAADIERFGRELEGFRRYWSGRKAL